MDLNDAAVRKFGHDRAALRGKSLNTIVATSGREHVHGLLDRCRGGETMGNVKCAFSDKAGQAVSVEILMLLLTDEQGTPDAVAVIAKPMT